MCVIIIKQKGNVMSKEVAKTSARINPHGLGIVWLDTFEVEYHKSSEYNRLITERPFIAHFRYATIGAINKANTHPFVCGANKDELLMMNGTIRGLGDANMCDSKALAINLGRIPRNEWKQELEQYDSRFVSINTRTRTFQIYNRHLYTMRNGIWYSKDNVLQENLVAVYGTLKKGYNNYYSYLTSSKFIGSGKTLNKYPLLIDGLPYMVHHVGMGHNVEVDVFKVSDTTLKNLDALEGHPRWYERKEIYIKMSNGRLLKCWVYFNPKEVKLTDKLHSTYVQNRIKHRGYKQWFKTEKEEEQVDDIIDTRDCNQIDLFDNEFDIEAVPTCVECYNDLEFDTFSNYYCSGCGAWYTETEARRLLM